MILDQATQREIEKQKQLDHHKRQIRSELEATVAYDQMQRLRKVKELQNIGK